VNPVPEKQSFPQGTLKKLNPFDAWEQSLLSRPLHDVARRLSDFAAKELSCNVREEWVNFF
jgi:hypothetical protein